MLDKMVKQGGKNMTVYHILLWSFIYLAAGFGFDLIYNILTIAVNEPQEMINDMESLVFCTIAWPIFFFINTTLLLHIAYEHGERNKKWQNKK